MPADRDLLTPALRDPARLAEYGLRDWDLLLRQARRALLTARLQVLAEANHLLDQLPEPVRWHLLAARRETDRHIEVVRWEVGRIEAALRASGMPVVLLKGAAYVMAGLPVAQGRMFGDVDILVPRAALAQAERMLQLNGWIPAVTNAYDQRYYRDWMHELPPLVHGTRQAALDVHHTILPPTARLKPDPAKLLHDAIRLDGDQELYVPASLDLILHSAAHLFHEGEFDNGLRDLVDIDGLIRHFEQQADFWPGLIERAIELDLAQPLIYALRYREQRLQVAAPDGLTDALKTRTAGHGAALIDALFRRALLPNHASCDDYLSGFARWGLYLRSHYLRMPMHLLIPHLVRKALRPAEDTRTT